MTSSRKNCNRIISMNNRIRNLIEMTYQCTNQLAIILIPLASKVNVLEISEATLLSCFVITELIRNILKIQL